MMCHCPQGGRSPPSIHADFGVFGGVVHTHSSHGVTEALVVAGFLGIGFSLMSFLFPVHIKLMLVDTGFFACFQTSMVCF